MINRNFRKIINRFSGLHKLKEMKDNVRFKCQKCGFCCRAFPVVATKKEAKHNKLLIENSKPIIKNLRLLSKKKNECVFLNEKNECDINNSKPILCQTYPFYYNSKNKKFYYDINCPGIGKGRKINLEKIKNLTLKFENQISKKELELRYLLIFEEKIKKEKIKL
ncbi:MAG: YkgJ family cysteine cluster protein [Candidatus Pacearchaeota archaeon]|nr:MAG: YkgJ family cysteine cluster protein [Candidatus Pacearchaeota archaeon]